MKAKSPAFNPQQVLDRSRLALAHLKRMIEVKSAENYVICLLWTEHALLKRAFDHEFTPEFIADMLLAKLDDISVSRAKLIYAIREHQGISESNPPKRRGRPPKSAAVAEKEQQRPTTSDTQSAVTLDRKPVKPKKSSNSKVKHNAA
jgi:hypothetical protein